LPFRCPRAAARQTGGGLVPVSAILPGMEALAPVLKEAERARAATPRGRHHFTCLNQIDALARIGEGDMSGMSFMARLLTLCSLPRTNPGERLQCKRQNGL
jgi:hypothetical protein